MHIAFGTPYTAAQMATSANLRRDAPSLSWYGKRSLQVLHVVWHNDCMSAAVTMLSGTNSVGTVVFVSHGYCA